MVFQSLLPYGFIATFLLVGLLLYERSGFRMGGVLVLPLLLIYALNDIAVLAVFILAAAACLLVGHLVYTHTMLYGRRMLVVFLLVSIAATLTARAFIPLGVAGFVLALIPGLYAYNAHREGKMMQRTWQFALWFGLLLAAGSVTLWIGGIRLGLPAIIAPVILGAFTSFGAMLLAALGPLAGVAIEGAPTIAGHPVAAQIVSFTGSSSVADLLAPAAAAGWAAAEGWASGGAHGE